MSVSPLEAHLGYWLRFVSNHVSQGFARKVEAHGVTVAEWVVLRELLDQGDMPPSQIADRLGMTRGAITKLADRLLAKDLITRTFRADDRRYQTLTIAQAGRDLVPVLAALADENDAAFFGGLEPADHAALERILKRLVQLNRLKTVPIE